MPQPLTQPGTVTEWMPIYNGDLEATEGPPERAELEWRQLNQIVRHVGDEVAAVAADSEEIAAQPADEGVDDLERGVGRNRRVYRVAASLEHVETSLRGQRMGRGDEPVSGHRLGAMLRQGP